MLRKLVVLILCLSFLASTSLVFAEEVFATKQGKKYHKENCRFIKNRDTQKIDIEEAKEKGLEPCSKCFSKTDKVTKKNIKNDDGEQMVSVTKSGKKYHKPECSLIKNKNTTEISIAGAEVENLAPCGKCFSKQQAKAK